MAIVGGFDIHRRQVTFDYADTVTGQVRRGRIAPACRETRRHWLERFAGCEDVTFAVEGCIGWRFVVEDLQRAGITALLAEPAETAERRGPKRRAKTRPTPGTTPSIIMSPEPANTVPRTEVRLAARPNPRTPIHEPPPEEPMT